MKIANGNTDEDFKMFQLSLQMSILLSKQFKKSWISQDLIKLDWWIRLVDTSWFDVGLTGWLDNGLIVWSTGFWSFFIQPPLQFCKEFLIKISVWSGCAEAETPNINTLLWQCFVTIYCCSRLCNKWTHHTYKHKLLLICEHHWKYLLCFHRYIR